MKSCQLVFLRCVTSQAVHVQSTWLTLREAFFAKNEVFESSSGGRSVSFPQMPQGRTHYEIHYTESYLIDFRSLSLLHPRTTTAASSSTLSHPICLIISRDMCTEDGNILFHLLFQTNALSSSPAYTSNFLHPWGKYLCVETDSWAFSCPLFPLPYS